MKYKRVSKRLQTLTETKTRSLAHQLAVAYPTWRWYKLHFKTFAKFHFDNADVL